MKKFYPLLLLLLQACSPETPASGILIENARHEPIYLQIERPEKNTDSKLVVIQHGLASDMKHPAVQTAKKAFLDSGYAVILFDSRYSMGKSGRGVAKARLSTFAEDLQTVINWVKAQKFYAGPPALAGHSLGGASVLQYAAEHPAEVSLLVPIAPVVSGQRWENNCLRYLDFCRAWQKNGFYDYENEQLSYQTVEEAKNFDAVKLADKIKAKVLLIGAADDDIVVPEDIGDLYQALQTEKTSVVIANSEHNFTTAQNQQDLYWDIKDFLYD